MSLDNPLNSTSTTPHRDPIPEHVLLQIIPFLAEPECFRMMGACRFFRGVIEQALRPSLMNRVMTQEPPIFGNHLSPPTTAPLEREDHTALSQKHAYYDSLLEAYPPAAILLRTMTIEVLDDTASGWNLIQRLPDGLESLVVHSSGERRSDGVDPDEEGDESNSDDEYADGEPDKWLAPVTAPIRFPSLTSLVLVTTATILPQADYLTRHAPNLRSLTLSCYSEEKHVSTGYDGPKMPGLEGLTLAGRFALVYDLWAEMGGRVPDFRYLTLNVDDPKEAAKGVRQGYFINWLPSRPEQLEGLAFYGLPAWRFKAAVKRYQQIPGAPQDMPKLRVLVLEEQTEMRADQGHAYPMLCELDREVERPQLSAISRITWVDRRLDKARYLRDDPSPHPNPVELYDPAVLQLLFADYPMLEHVQWVNAFPVDPFADFNAEFISERMLCRVSRAEALPEILVKGPRVAVKLGSRHEIVRSEDGVEAKEVGLLGRQT